MKNINVDIRCFCVVGTLLMVNFIEHGYISVVVKENSGEVLYTTTIYDNEQPVNMKGWLEAFYEGNIIISPN